MKNIREIYISTVALDPTRWGRRIPSFDVSAWLPRFAGDGFDGVELWEFHFLPAEKADQERLVAAASSVAIYNSYVGFADEDAEARAAAAEAITRLQPRAVKYNLGGDAARKDEYRRNLLAWADALPADCRLLCECHQGSILEQVADAAAFFASAFFFSSAGFFSAVAAASFFFAASSVARAPASRDSATCGSSAG